MVIRSRRCQQLPPSALAFRLALLAYSCALRGAVMLRLGAAPCPFRAVGASRLHNLASPLGRFGSCPLSSWLVRAAFSPAPCLSALRLVPSHIFVRFLWRHSRRSSALPLRCGSAGAQSPQGYAHALRLIFSLFRECFFVFSINKNILANVPKK